MITLKKVWITFNNSDDFLKEEFRVYATYSETPKKRVKVQIESLDENIQTGGILNKEYMRNITRCILNEKEHPSAIVKMWPTMSPYDSSERFLISQMTSVLLRDFEDAENYKEERETEQLPNAKYCLVPIEKYESKSFLHDVKLFNNEVECLHDFITNNEIVPSYILAVEGDKYQIVEKVFA